MSAAVSPAGPPMSSPSVWRSGTLRGNKFLVLAILALLCVSTIAFVLIFIIRLGRKNPKSDIPDSSARKIDHWESSRCSLSLNAKLLPNLVSAEQHNLPLISCQLESREAIGEFHPQFDRHSHAWGLRRFSFKEIEIATNGFSNDNVTGIEDGDVTYRGVLLDTTRVAVKVTTASFVSDEFEAEVELLGHARHKNLAILIGVCVEGGFRMLVSEYVDNGSLHWWLHNWREEISPLTWKLRMFIIRGIAKGLAYLHEDLQQKIIHQALRSSIVLLDRHWIPKLSDFGFSKLCGYHEDDSLPDDLDDVYQYGELVLETVSGRRIVDDRHPQRYLVDWMKVMIMEQKVMEVIDPRLAETPSPMELKGIVLLALRCVDSNKKSRPTMAEVVRILEPRDLLIDDVRISMEDATLSPQFSA